MSFTSISSTSPTTPSADCNSQLCLHSVLGAHEKCISLLSPPSFIHSLARAHLLLCMLLFLLTRDTSSLSLSQKHFSTLRPPTPTPIHSEPLHSLHCAPKYRKSVLCYRYRGASRRCEFHYARITNFDYANMFAGRGRHLAEGGGRWSGIAVTIKIMNSMKACSREPNNVNSPIILAGWLTSVLRVVLLRVAPWQTQIITPPTAIIEINRFA